MKKTIILILILLIGCQMQISIIKFENGKTISVEIADNTAERTKGLMNREELAPDTGMLFIFDNEQERSFWMKNTLIPLDMIFVNSEMKIVKIRTAEPCETEKCELYKSVEPAKYVIEANAGYCALNEIKEGQTVTFK